MAEENEKFYINYDMVTQAKELLPITRLLAVDLKKNPYLSVGDFLKNLSDNTLQEMVDYGDKIKDDPSVVGDFVLISMMLAAAEGLDSEADSDTAQDWANSLVTFFALESLHRKGLVKLRHENLSFGEDYANKIIVEKIQH